jgi:uncharacterized protein
MKKSLTILLLLTTVFCFAQNKNDMLLIANHNNTNTPVSPSTIHFSKGKNPLTFPFRGALYFYQSCVSVQWQTACGHSPSCSNFAKQAIGRWGIIKGIAITADRLSRCSPLSFKNYRYYEYDSRADNYPDSPLLYLLKK